MAGSDPLQPLLHGDPLRPEGVDLDALAAGLGHRFLRAELAAEALTHRSALDRQPDRRAAHPHANERLEFLGDRVLSLALADMLLQRFPAEREGSLARRHADLVQAATLSDIAREIGLAAHLVLGDSERGEPTKSAILADALEALLGAIFLDSGFEAASACIARLWQPRLEQQIAAPQDPKTALQEWTQARRMALPAYRELGRDGPAHAPTFVIEVSVKGQQPASGRGPSKREAEREAARTLLSRLVP